jgi:hypothetical protein
MSGKRETISPPEVLEGWVCKKCLGKNFSVKPYLRWMGESFPRKSFSWFPVASPPPKKKKRTHTTAPFSHNTEVFITVFLLLCIGSPQKVPRIDAQWNKDTKEWTQPSPTGHRAHSLSFLLGLCSPRSLSWLRSSRRGLPNHHCHYWLASWYWYIRSLTSVLSTFTQPSSFMWYTVDEWEKSTESPFISASYVNGVRLMSRTTHEHIHTYTWPKPLSFDVLFWLWKHTPYHSAATESPKLKSLPFSQVWWWSIGFLLLTTPPE